MIPKDRKAGVSYVELSKGSLRYFAYCPQHERRSSVIRSAQQPDFEGKTHWMFACSGGAEPHLFPATPVKGAPRTKEDVQAWVEKLSMSQLKAMT